MPKIENRIHDFFVKLNNPAVVWDIQHYEQRLQEVNNIELKALYDSELQNMAYELKKKVRAGTPPGEAAVCAFALVREAARRVLGMRPFDVQVIAGMAMADGNLAEMQTGEGKTLAAVFPVFLNALRNESHRIDRQLRGRAGRQGDPGCSRRSSGQSAAQKGNPACAKAY